MNLFYALLPITIFLSPLGFVLIEKESVFRISDQRDNVLLASTSSMSATQELVFILIVSALVFSLFGFTLISGLKLANGHKLNIVFHTHIRVVLPLVCLTATLPIVSILSSQAVYITFTALTTSDYVGLIPVVGFIIPTMVITLVMSGSLIMCFFDVDVLRPTWLSATNAGPMTIVTGCLVTTIVIHNLPSSLGGDSVLLQDMANAIGVLLMGAATVVVIVGQQFIKKTSNAILAFATCHMAGICLASRLHSINPAVMLGVNSLVCIGAFASSFWPVLITPVMKPFVRDVQRTHVDGTPGPALSAPPIADRLAAVSVRGIVRRIRRNKNKFERRTRHIPVALPGFAGVDQFAEDYHELATPDDCVFTQTLFHLFRYLLASHPRSVELHVTYALCVLKLKPANINFALKQCDRVIKDGDMGWRVDVSYAVYAVYRRRLDVLAGGAEAKERYERNRRLNVIRRATRELVESRRTFWGSVLDDQCRSLSTARLGRLVGLISEEARLSNTARKNFSVLLPKATPKVLREYSAFVSGVLGKEADAQPYLALADDMETSGRGHGAVQSAPVPAADEGKGFMLGLIKTRTELQCLVGIAVMLLLFVGLVGIVYLLTTFLLGRLHWIFYAFGAMRLSAFIAHLGAMQVLLVRDPRLLMSLPLMMTPIMPLAMYSGSDESIRAALDSFGSTYPLLSATNLDTNKKIQDFLATQPTGLAADVNIDMGYPSTDTVMHTVIMFITSHMEYLEENKLDTGDGHGLPYTTVVEHFFATTNALARENIHAIANDPDPSEFFVLGPDPTANMREIQEIRMLAGIVEEYITKAFKKAFLANTDFPQQTVSATLAGMLVYGAGLFVLMFGVFMIPVLRDATKSIALFRMCFTLPPDVLGVLAGRRPRRASQSSERRASLIPVDTGPDDELVDAASMARATTLEWDSSDEDEACPAADVKATRYWRQTQFRLVLARMATLAPKTAMATCVIIATVVGLMLVIMYQVLNIGRDVTSGYMIYNTMVFSMSWMAKMSDKWATELDPAADSTEITAQCVKVLDRIDEGLTWLESGSLEIEDKWLPAPSNELGVWLRQVTRDVLPGEWSAGTSQDQIISLLFDKSCPLKTLIPNQCSGDTLSGSMDPETEGVMSSGLVGALSYYTVLMRMVMTHPRGTVTGDVLPLYIMVISDMLLQSIVPYSLSIVNLIRDRFLSSITLVGNLALLAVGVMVAELAAAYWFIIRADATAVLHQHQQLLLSLDFVYYSQARKLPNATRKELRALRPRQTDDEWIEE